MVLPMDATHGSQVFRQINKSAQTQSVYADLSLELLQPQKHI